MSLHDLSVSLMNVETSFEGKSVDGGRRLVAFARALWKSVFEGKVAISSHLSSVLSKKVCCNDETEGTINCSPAHKLDEKFERSFRDDPSNPSHGQYYNSRFRS